jgi:hypothetical protein
MVPQILPNAPRIVPSEKINLARGVEREEKSPKNR